MFVKFLFFVRLKADLSDPILKRMRAAISDWKNYQFLQKRKITKNKLKCAFLLTTIKTGKYYLTNNKTMKYKHIVFDIDGTLIDTENACNPFYQEAIF